MPLTLTRRPTPGRDVITVDGPAEIRVVKSSAGCVRIQVTAPGTTTVLRGELTPQTDQGADHEQPTEEN